MTNKQEIKQRLEEVKEKIIILDDIISRAESAKDELSDYTLEESELELELAKIEEDDELTTKPWSHADDENDNER